MPEVDELRSRGIEAALGDLSDQGSLEAAMDGVDTLFLLTAANRSQAEYGRNAVRAAEAAGVGRIVHLSSGDANPVSKTPWAAAPARTDALLRVSSLVWTILKPSAFMQNILDSAPAIRRGLLPHAAGTSPVGWIDTADIAAVATKVLVEARHEHQEYVLTGPELLDFRDLAAVIASVVHRPVRALNLPAPAYHLLLRLSGLDAWTASAVVHQFADGVRHGRDGANNLTDSVTAILGRRPVSFEDFVIRHRDRFAAA